VEGGGVGRRGAERREEGGGGKWRRKIEFFRIRRPHVMETNNFPGNNFSVTANFQADFSHLGVFLTTFSPLQRRLCKQGSSTC
jgi:hypothetical protein